MKDFAFDFSPVFTTLGAFVSTQKRSYGPGRKTLYTRHKNVGKGKYPPYRPLQLITAPEEGRGVLRRDARKRGAMRFQILKPLSARQIAFGYKKARTAGAA